MKKIYFFSTVLIFMISVAFIGYGIYLNQTSDSHIETMMANRAVGLNGVRAVHRDLRPEIFLETIGLYTEREADAIAQTDGIVEEIYVTQWQDVRRGDRLFRVINPEIPLQVSRADTDIARAQAAYLQAQSTLERDRKLAQKNAISSSELEAAASQMKAAKAEFDAARIARNQIEQQKTFQTVRSPLNGMVILVYQQAGNYVSKGTPMVMVADFGRMYFRGAIQDEKIKNLVPLDDVFTFHIDLSDMTGRVFDNSAREGFSEQTAFDTRITEVSPPLSVDVPVRTVRWELDNRIGIVTPGRYRDVVIRKRDAKRALSVPGNALHDGPTLYIADRDSRLAMRRVTTGARDGRYVEILDGLEEGDIVVTSGVDGLSPGIKINVNVVEEETR